MGLLKITAKGQVTLRKDLLNHIGLGPGDQIEAHKLPNGVVEVRAARPRGQISSVFGLLKDKTSVTLTLEQIDEIASDGWAGKP